MTESADEDVANLFVNFSLA